MTAKSASGSATRSTNDKTKSKSTSEGKSGAKRKGRSKVKARKARRTAATSDRHELYELSVQAPENEVRFIDKVWKKLRGRKPTSFREDFAGTMYLAATWVRHRRGNTAIAVDLDPEVQAWGLRDRKSVV